MGPWQLIDHESSFEMSENSNTLEFVDIIYFVQYYSDVGEVSLRKLRSPTIDGLQVNGPNILFAYRKRLINILLENN